MRAVLHMCCVYLIFIGNFNCQSNEEDVERLVELIQTNQEKAQNYELPTNAERFKASDFKNGNQIF